MDAKPWLLSATGSSALASVWVWVCVWVVAGAAAYLSVKFLIRYFQTRTLTPFAIYCLVFGAAMVVRFAAF